MSEKKVFMPSGKVDKLYFMPGGKVPEGKDGNLIWREEDPRAGLVWFSKPVSREELPPDVEEKTA
jgi:hypothetical protein